MLVDLDEAALVDLEADALRARGRRCCGTRPIETISRSNVAVCALPSRVTGAGSASRSFSIQPAGRTGARLRSNRPRSESATRSSDSTWSIRNGPTTAWSRHQKATTNRATAQSASAANIAPPSRRATDVQARQGDEPDDRDDDEQRLVDLGGIGRHLGSERAPRAGTGVCRGPRQVGGRALAGRTEDAGELPGREDEQERERGRVQPASDRRADQPRDDRAGQDPERHGEGQVQAALAEVRDDAGIQAVVVEVVEDVAEAAAEQRTRHDPDRDEEQVVGAQARRLHVRSGRRCELPDPGREDEASQEHDGDHDRLDADGREITQLHHRIERERQDANGHGSESIDGAPLRSMNLALDRPLSRSCSVSMRTPGPIPSRAVGGRSVLPIGLGTWAIGGATDEVSASGDRGPFGWGTVDDGESIRAIHRALDLGAQLFDTANNYGAGRSERLLGQALRRPAP